MEFYLNFFQGNGYSKPVQNKITFSMQFLVPQLRNSIKSVQWLQRWILGTVTDGGVRVPHLCTWCKQHLINSVFESILNPLIIQSFIWT